MRKFLLLIGVLLAPFIAGLSVVWGYAYVNGWIIGHSADGTYGMMYVAGAFIFAMLSPSLLLPYAIMFWRKPARALASLLMAAICGGLYPILFCLLLIVAPSLDPSEAWAAPAGVALIPGMILAFLGTHFGQRIGSNASGGHSESPPI